MSINWDDVTRVATGNDASAPDTGKTFDIEKRKQEVGDKAKAILASLASAPEVVKNYGSLITACCVSLTLTPYKCKTGKMVLPQGAFVSEVRRSVASMVGTDKFDKDLYRAVLDKMKEGKLLYSVRVGRSLQLSFFPPAAGTDTADIAAQAKAWLASLSSK